MIVKIYVELSTKTSVLRSPETQKVVKNCSVCLYVVLVDWTQGKIYPTKKLSQNLYFRPEYMQNKLHPLNPLLRIYYQKIHDRESMCQCLVCTVYLFSYPIAMSLFLNYRAGNITRM